jgi:hypothetical protein
LDTGASTTEVRVGAVGEAATVGRDFGVADGEGWLAFVVTGVGDETATAVSTGTISACAGFADGADSPPPKARAAAAATVTALRQAAATTTRRLRLLEKLVWEFGTGFIVFISCFIAFAA